MAVVLSLVSAAAFGCGDFFGGLGSRRASALSITAASQLLGGALVLLAAVVVSGRLTVGDFVLGMAGGLLSLTAIACFYRGLAIGPMGVVAALSAVTSVALPATIGLAAGERPSALAAVGIGIGVVAVILITREGARPAAAVTGGAIVLALVAGAGFGGFFAVLDATSDDAGLWPLVGARLTGAMLFLGAAALGRLRIDPGPGARGLAALAGTFDMVGNVFILLAVREGLLTLVAVIAGLYPATTILLARIVLAERLHRTQVGGLVLAAGSVSLIAAG